MYDDEIEGVVGTLVCTGEVYSLEIQIQSDGTVVGTAWREIHPTFWEPGDTACVHEADYPSVTEARTHLELIDFADYQYQLSIDDSQPIEDQERLEN